MNVVYTAILGACDSLKQAPTGADRAFCFTDDPEHLADPKGWEIVQWSLGTWQEPNPRREAWRLRCLPHELFDYSTVAWVDASVTVTDFPRLVEDAKAQHIASLKHHNRTCAFHEGRELVNVGQADPVAVNAQLDGYRAAGFQPRPLSISFMLVRSNTHKAAAFNVMWDQEIRQHAGDNTQLSLDYCAWSTGLTVHPLEGSCHRNPYGHHDAMDHRRRRKPYR